MTRTERRPALRADALYLGDNGRCFCGALECAGQTAYFTGRDLSGQRVEEIRRPSVSTLVRNTDFDAFACEGCGKGLGSASAAIPPGAYR